MNESAHGTGSSQGTGPGRLLCRRLIARHRADGVIVMSLALSPDHLTSFRRANVPLVTVDLAARSVPHTVIDDVAGGRLAAEHLLALGHARIGFIGDRARRGLAATGGSTSSERRRAGLYDALRAAGIGVDPSLTRLGPHGPASAEAMAAGLLPLPDPPTAIFAASDNPGHRVLSGAYPVPGAGTPEPSGSRVQH